MDFPNIYLALGDSYTIGESVDFRMNFPNQLLKKLKKDKKLGINAVKIIAQTGWTTDELQTAMNEANIHEHQYGLVSLLIGVNNQYRGRDVESYKTEFESLLQQAIALAGGDKSRVFVVSIPDYAYTPFGKRNEDISNGIDIYNAANESITKKYGVNYGNITPISRKGTRLTHYVAADDLHPSARQYSRWANLLYNIFFK